MVNPATVVEDMLSCLAELASRPAPSAVGPLCSAAGALREIIDLELAAAREREAGGDPTDRYLQLAHRYVDFAESALEASAASGGPPRGFADMIILVCGRLAWLLGWLSAKGRERGVESRLSGLKHLAKALLRRWAP